MQRPVKLLPLLVSLVIATAAPRSQSFEAVTTAAVPRDVSAVEALIAPVAGQQDYMPGELLVQFRPGVAPSAQTSALRVLRAQPGPDAARWIGDTLHLTGIGDDPERAAAALARQPEVLFAQPNYLRQLHSTPNDPEYSRQWNMDAINMPLAWEINSGAGTGVVVAVLDTGLTTAQSTYGFRIWNGVAFGVYGVPFSRTADFDHARVRTGAEFTPFIGEWRTGNQMILFDAVGHGTHVAGTIAQQTNNRNGYAGVANGATILPVKVCFGAWDLQMAAGALGMRGRVRGDEGGCDDAGVAAGIRYAVDNGAKVINMSLGGPQPAPIELAALRYAVQRGVFVSIASGNSALKGNPTNYPAAYAAQLDGVVAVGAVTRSQARAVYSSHGPYVEIAAPGGAGVSGPSEDVWQMIPNADDLSVRRVAPAFNRYVGGAIAGTSMAAPHVAGMAALLYSQGITNPAAIEAAIKRFARDLGPPGRDNEYGFGLIDARTTLLGLGVSR